MSFKDIKGQDSAIRILREHLKEFRLKNAYLFVGPEGVGKRLVAEILAKAANCAHGPLDSCDRCSSCLKIEKNQYPDVHIIDVGDISNSESRIKIDHIRQLQKDINLKPYEGKLKVFIIDNAHNLTPEASNALLKILEEPPVNSLIILVSAKPTLLFKTVISRCQILKFYPLARHRLEDILKRDYSLDGPLAHFLGYFCEGKIGCALRLKDTDIMKDKNAVINQFVLSKKSNLGDILTKNRDQMRTCLNILAGWFRDIYLIKVGIPYSELINLDRKTELLKSMKVPFLEIEEILNCISDSLLYLGQNVNIKLLLSDLRARLWIEQS